MKFNFGEIVYNSGNSDTTIMLIIPTSEYYNELILNVWGAKDINIEDVEFYMLTLTGSSYPIFKRDRGYDNSDLVKVGASKLLEVLYASR